MGMLGSVKARIGLASAIVAALASIGLVVGSWFSPSVDRAQRAYDRRDWTAAASTAARVLDRYPSNRNALRIRARALSRLGLDQEATPLFARLSGPELGAEDLLLIGEGALRANRPGLGLLAIEAAPRLDPRHAESVDRLDRLRRAPGPSTKVDRVLAILDGPTLSELVIGLASMDPTRLKVGESDPTMDRVLSRDRATFARLDTPSAARKLLARVALEGGLAREARDQLDRVDDPEAHWLLGRAALVEGDLAGARLETTRAGRFGLDDVMAGEPSRYVGAARCAGCHAEIYQSQQTSHHSATLSRGERLRGVPLPKGDLVDPENPGVSHRMDRQGDEVRVSSTVGGSAIEAIVDYAIGSGNHGVTMLARDKQGRHRSMRISYYARGQHWGLTSGFEPRPVDPASYVGEVLNDESFRNCLNCHTTRFVADRSRPGPEALDRGIGCERCHGPGDHHVRAMEAGFDQPAIARPRLASPAARMKLCAQCHGSDGVIPPADPRFIRFQAATLPYSRCVTESGARLDCVACHDPHKDLETSQAVYESRCLSCHGDKPAARKEGPAVGHRVEAVAASRCPVNPAGGCVSCHMPKVEDVMPFMSFTDHHIRARRPSKTADRGPR